MSALVRPLFALIAIFIGGSLALAQVPQSTYTSLVIFGDSLSDTGNIAHLTQTQFVVRYPGPLFNYTNGRFTDGTDTRPAATAFFGTWVDQLAATLPTPFVLKNSLDGGTNYAFGDATTEDGTRTTTATVAGTPVSLTIENMGQQVIDYLATHPTPTRQTLYILWGGANDLYADSSAASVSAAVNREMALAQRLVDAGAADLLLADLPPLGSVPGHAADTATATALNAATQSFNSQLHSGLISLNLSNRGKALRLFNSQTNLLFQVVTANAAALGFTNLTSPAQSISGNPDTYLFWDTLHPTTAIHHLLATTAATLIQPPTLPVTVTLIPSASVIDSGAAVAFTATVTSPNAHPSGTISIAVDSSVSFSSGSHTGILSLPGLPTRPLLPVLSSFETTLSAGTHTITAIFDGDSGFESATTSITQTVTATPAVPAATTTTLTTPATSVAPATPITFTATIASAAAPPLGGAVTFFDSGVSIGTAPPTSLGATSLTSSIATFTTSTLAAGTHTLTAAYSPVNALGLGAANLFLPSTSSPLIITVAPPGITAALSSATVTVAAGATATTTATLTPISGFNGTVALACGSLPTQVTCAIAPASLSFNGVTAAQTTAQTATVHISTDSSKPAAAAFLLLPLTGLGMLFALRRRRFNLGLLALTLVLSATGVLGLSGCGGSNSKARPGTYTVPITVTPATGAPTTLNLSLIVQ